MVNISMAHSSHNTIPPPASLPSHAGVKKLIIMDVDGVLFKGQFILHLARSLGILVYVRTAILCLFF